MAEFINMTSTADDSVSPPADVHPSPESSRDNDNDGNEEHSGNQNNKNVALQNPVTLPEIDRLGLETDPALNDGATDLTAGDKPKLQIQISPEQRKRELKKNRCEVIYNFPPDISSLNINGRPRFELVTERENGRLQMYMVPNRSPQLVRSPVKNGRLTMWLLNDDQHGGEKVLPPYVRRSI